MALAFHPYADAFPLVEGDDFFALCEDIRRHGLRKPVELFAGSILDGRNRYRALAWLASTGEALGDGWGHRSGLPLPADILEPAADNILFRTFDPALDGNPIDYVASLNLRRRDLSLGQRAMAAAELGRLGWGGNRSKPSREGLSAERRAEIAGVGRATVERAETVIDRGVPDLREAVRTNAVPVAVAAEVAALPASRQAEIVAQLPRDDRGRLTPEARTALAPIMKEVRAERQAEKRERRAAREQELGDALRALPARHFGVAIEDFEWDHAAWSRETGLDRHPSNHYETAADAHTPEEIVARCAERFRCLAEHCILFKWTTIPHLAIAMRVLELQGFEYKTHLVWAKRRAGNARGPGYWFTGEHEIVLVGVRGNVVAPATAHFRSLFDAPVGAHSEKPDHLHEIVEHHWPNIPKIEFNARRPRPGWEMHTKGTTVAQSSI